LTSTIERAISFLWVKESFSQFALAVLLFANSFFNGSGGVTVRGTSSRSISTVTVSPAFTPAPSRISRLTTIR
jgi:hypothetical protein